MFYETFSGNIGSTVRHEYLPREMVPRPYVSAVQWQAGTKPAPLALQGALGSADLLRSGVGWEAWRIAVPSEALLAFHTTYIPGWRATVDGRAQAIEPLPGLGLLGLRLGPGEHRIILRLEMTRTQRAAWYISLLALPLSLALLLYDYPRSPRTRRRALLGGAALVLSAAWLSFSPLRQPSAAPPDGPLVADFSRAPYLHHEPGGVVWGQVRLVSYELSHDHLSPGQTLRLVAAWDRPCAQCRVRVALAAATAHLLEPAPTWAEASAALDQATTSLDLVLPQDIPPGLYVPRLAIWDAHGPQTPRTAAGAAMGDIVLRPIRVEPGRRATGQESVLGSFGPENAPPVISLLGARLSRLEGAALVQLDWRCERQAPLNYALSVRLRDKQGKTISRDLPPLVGGYPTSLWQPGELVSDRVLIPWPASAPLPGGSFDLEVVLYDRLTLKGAGVASAAVTLPD